MLSDEDRIMEIIALVNRIAQRRALVPLSADEQILIRDLYYVLTARDDPAQK